MPSSRTTPPAASTVIAFAQVSGSPGEQREEAVQAVRFFQVVAGVAHVIGRTGGELEVLPANVEAEQQQSPTSMTPPCSRRPRRIGHCPLSSIAKAITSVSCGLNASRPNTSPADNGRPRFRSRNVAVRISRQTVPFWLLVKLSITGMKATAATAAQGSETAPQRLPPASWAVGEFGPEGKHAFAAGDGPSTASQTWPRAPPPSRPPTATRRPAAAAGRAAKAASSRTADRRSAGSGSRPKSAARRLDRARATARNRDRRTAHGRRRGRCGRRSTPAGNRRHRAMRRAARIAKVRREGVAGDNERGGDDQRQRVPRAQRSDCGRWFCLDGCHGFRRVGFQPARAFILIQSRSGGFSRPLCCRRRGNESPHYELPGRLKAYPT